MHAVKRSPLFRIALLSFAVLFAQTGRATRVQHIAPVKPPCARKVAATKPDTDKKLTPAIKRIVRPGSRAHFHTFFPGPLGFSNPAAFDCVHTSGLPGLTRNPAFPPQRRTFALRI